MEGNLSIINQWWKPQKGGGKFLNFSGGKQKGGDTIFDLNLVGGRGGDLEETMSYHYLSSPLVHTTSWADLPLASALTRGVKI